MSFDHLYINSILRIKKVNYFFIDSKHTDQHSTSCDEQLLYYLFSISFPTMLK